MSSKRILLVEVNEDNRDMLSRRLTRKGYSVIIAVDGVQGVEQARAEQPDLILMDMSLPLMDGWEATRRLKAEATTQRIPVIALTAHAMSGDKEKALAVGCDDYDTKPVDLKRLLPKMEALLIAEVRPVASTADSGSSKPSSSPTVAEKKRSFLLVDDNENNRDMLSRRLEKKGYNVTTAADGSEALSLLQKGEHQFDLILLDVMMPGINGIDVLTQLRQSYTPSELPIIMVTAKDQSEDMIKALELGANDYITKPVDFPVALARIQTQVARLEQSEQDQAKRQVATAPPAVDVNLLKGRYRLTQVLGEGGFGRTYLARDTHRPGEPVCVVKQLYPSQTDARSLEMARRLFNTEAETLERLKHDQIPKLLAYFEEREDFFLVQEFIEGSLLSEELDQQRFSEIQVLAMLWDLLHTLQYVHRQNVIHRDIKPQNIIRRKQTKKLVLIDFGAVKAITLNRTEMAYTVGIGSRGYAPIEQYAGRPRYNSDIYAVGMVAVHALTGLAPDQLDDDYNTGELLWQQKVQVNPAITTLVNRMIHPNSTERYQSTAEVLQDLRQIAKAVRRSQVSSRV